MGRALSLYKVTLEEGTPLQRAQKAVTSEEGKGLTARVLSNHLLHRYIQIKPPYTRRESMSSIFATVASIFADIFAYIFERPIPARSTGRSTEVQPFGTISSGNPGSVTLPSFLMKPRKSDSSVIHPAQAAVKIARSTAGERGRRRMIRRR